MTDTQAADVDRFRTSRRGNVTTRLAAGKPELSKRDKVLLEWVTVGLPRKLPRWPEVTPGIPLSVEQAGEMLCMRRKYVRELVLERVWQQAMAREIARVRDGAALKAVRTIVDKLDHVGQGKAADAKVQLEAAQMILGDTVGKSAVTVNVVQTNQTNVAPGYVLDLRPDSQRKTIDGEIER